MVEARRWTDTARAGTVSRRMALGFAMAPLLAQAQAEPAGGLERLRSRGRLIVAVYQELPPFSSGGEGVDVEVARALAARMRLEASLLPLRAGENMHDDLRNAVSGDAAGGSGRADVMLHVPMEAPLMRSNPRVHFLAPYYRERLALARDLKRLPRGQVRADFAGQQIAVAGQSLAGWLMTGAEAGAWREQLVSTSRDGLQAARALARGEVAAAAGLRSELESVLGADARFAIDALPVPRLREGWAIGCAVRRESLDLARALQEAMNALAVQGDLARIFARAGLSWLAP